MDRTISAQVKKFFRCESGATSIEYSLIGGLISIIILVSVSAIGTKTSNQFTKVGAALK